MASYSVRDYLSAETSETAYRATDARLMPTRPGAFTSRVTRIEFEQLWVNCVMETGARLKQLVTRPDRVHVGFVVQSGVPMIIDGSELRGNGLVRYPRHDECFERSMGSIQWCAVSMPVEAMLAAGAALTGHEVLSPARPIITEAAPHAMQKFKQLCAEASALAERGSGLLAIPATARSLEQALTSALVECLAEPQATGQLPRHSARMIVDRFQRVIEANPDQALYLPEVCAAIRVSERTLRQSCQKLLGMSPARYLLLRRMHLAHRSLRAAKPGTTNVTEVATKFGFWHFGRFATTYRSLFGEIPSATLNRRPD